MPKSGMDSRRSEVGGLVWKAVYPVPFPIVTVSGVWGGTAASSSKTISATCEACDVSST